MKKAFFAMFCMCIGMSYAAEPIKVTDRPTKQVVIAQPIETSAGEKLGIQAIKGKPKKSTIEICSCYDQVKPPCWKSTDLPPCPK